MDCGLPGSSVHRIFQARAVEWVAISSSRGSSRPRDWTQVSRIAGRRFTVRATREARKEKWKLLSHVWLFATLWTVQSMEISRPEQWSGSFSLLQGIFPTQGSNLGLPHCRRILYRLSPQGRPRILEWVPYPFSSRSSWPRIESGSPALHGVRQNPRT